MNLIPPEATRRDHKNEDGAWGRSYSFHSSVNCCSGTLLIKDLDPQKRTQIMTLAQTCRAAYPSWRSGLIVLDSICSCKGSSDSCPVKSALRKVGEQFPETNPRYTTRFLPRIKIKIGGLLEDPDQAWMLVKEAFPSSSNELGGTPKVVTKWKDSNRLESTFIFEVPPNVRHMLAGRNIRNRTASIQIRDSIYVPYCKKCRRIGHKMNNCRSDRQILEASVCLSCSEADHHPFSVNCPSRDRIIRAKLARIDYGAKFRNRIVLYQ